MELRSEESEALLRLVTRQMVGITAMEDQLQNAIAAAKERWGMVEERDKTIAALREQINNGEIELTKAEEAK